jgi:hypothetical protein
MLGARLLRGYWRFCECLSIDRINAARKEELEHPEILKGGLGVSAFRRQSNEA